MVRLRFDRRFAEFEWEFSTLDAMRLVFESEIPELADREQQRRFAELKAKGWDDDEAERQQVWQEVDHLREQVIPRFTRGPLIIALWAAYESAVVEIAQHLHDASSALLWLDDIRGGNFLSRAHKYFRAVLGTELDVDSARVQRLHRVLAVRNAFAHGNGAKRSVHKNQWKHAIQVTGNADTDDYLVVSAELLSQAFSDVADSATALIQRVRGGPIVKILPAAEDEITQ